jgi:4-hydroxy-2-oxoheptanedioate aldolase
VKEIAMAPGIDVLFVGPFDLGVSIGRPITGGKMDKVLVDVIQSVQDAAQAARIAADIYCDGGEDAKEWASKGFLMNRVVTDMIGLRQVVSQTFKSAE